MRGRGLPWAEIEAEWQEARADGTPNVAELARKYGCHASGIRNRAVRYNWASPNARQIQTELKTLPGDIVIGRKGTPEIIGGILDGLERGVTLGVACAVNGITPMTFRNWREADEELELRVKEAQGKSAQTLLGHMHEAAERDWKAAEALLARNAVTKDDFGAQDTKKGGTINVQINIPRPGDTEQRYADVIDITED